MFRITISNAQTKGSRRTQEDAFGSSLLPEDGLIKEDAFAAIVADGIGGLPHGEYASRIAVQSFLRAYAGTAPGIEERLRLRRALEQANSSVYSFREGLHDWEDLGTTLVAASINRKGLEWISTGDSHIYLLRDKQLVQLNTDHVYLGDLFEQVNKGMITYEEAMEDPRAEALTSYIGSRVIPQIDQNSETQTLRVGDMLLLCSDGVYRILTDEEIISFLADPTEDSANILISAVEDKNMKDQDNATAIVICVKSTGEYG